MTDPPSQQPLYYCNTHQWNRRSKDETYQNLAKPVSERSEREYELNSMATLPIKQPSQLYQPVQSDQCSSESDEIYDDLTLPELTEAGHERDPMTNAHTQQLSQLHQPLQDDQCSNDEIYEDFLKLELTGAEYELDPMTNMHTQQQNTHWSPKPIQGDFVEINQGVTKEVELDNMKTAIKKMKMVLVITVIVNIVLLVLVTMVVVLGNVRSPLKFGTNSYVSELTASTERSINQVSMQLNMTNGTVISALNQLNITRSNISDITTELNEAKSNTISVQTQVDILQTQVASLLPQVSDLQLQVYCGPGEWRQVAYLNMGDPTQQCPSAWRECNTSGVRACGRPSTNGGSCAATTYSINFQYRRVCGRVVGYQLGSTDGFYRSGNINQQYVDGISITRGSPREHVWTYVSGWSERQINDGNCPCSTRPGREGPLYVGNNYYCESGSLSYPLNNYLYSSDKLWDGKQCEGSCCTGTDTPPWFSVQFNTTTSDNIEVRICGSESTMNEDTPVELLVIYGAL